MYKKTDALNDGFIDIRDPWFNGLMNSTEIWREIADYIRGLQARGIKISKEERNFVIQSFKTCIESKRISFLSAIDEQREIYNLTYSAYGEYYYNKIEELKKSIVEEFRDVSSRFESILTEFFIPYSEACPSESESISLIGYYVALGDLYRYNSVVLAENSEESLEAEQKGIKESDHEVSSIDSVMESISPFTEEHEELPNEKKKQYNDTELFYLDKAKNAYNQILQLRENSNLSFSNSQILGALLKHAVLQYKVSKDTNEAIESLRKGFTCATQEMYMANDSDYPNIIRILRKIIEHLASWCRENPEYSIEDLVAGMNE